MIHVQFANSSLHIQESAVQETNVFAQFANAKFHLSSEPDSNEE